MADYRRFLSYIYEYRQNGKGRNAGFVKVEIRDGQLYLQMNLRGLVPTPRVSAFGLYQEDAAWKHIPLCKVAMNNGRGQYSFQGPEKQFGDGRPFISYLGLAFVPEQNSAVKYATVWEDADIRDYLFSRPTNKAESNPTKIIEETKITDGNEITENTENTKTAASNEITEDSNEIAEDTITIDGIRDVDSLKEVAGDQAVEELQNQEVTFEEIPLRENSLWEKIKRDNPSVDTLREDFFLTCVKGQPGDLGRLPKRNWIFGNNSYLLYGYLRYHHILFLQTRENTFLIGVPGHQEQEEEILAHLCGFNEFHPAEGDSEDFGYWCAPITLTESSKMEQVHQAAEVKTAR